ncbi:nuclease [Nocardiopsis gilva YIM 90087]|uniref:Nuclease n=1 Tax=Nocardiopsis gilva YIM 90087 TaxID=1235441 RepID=A0A223S9T8_9ACTN|nr:nuclease [Nocardiopsis gilva YIM 90087]
MDCDSHLVGPTLSSVESATRVKEGEQSPGPTYASPFVTSDSSRFRSSPGLKDVASRTYGSLLAGESTRRWAIRGGAAVVIGLAAGFLMTDWRIGVTVGAAALIGMIVHYMRRQSEVPRWRTPSAAQRKTEAQLRVMQKMGYRVLHARGIPGGNGQIDHFIVGRRGAFAIDSESWDKRLPLRNKLEKLYHGRFSKNERIDEALEEALVAERLVSEELGREIKVRASLAIYGPGMPWDSHRLRGVDIIQGTKVRKWLRTGKDRLTETEIEEIYQAALKVLPQRY